MIIMIDLVGFIANSVADLKNNNRISSFSRYQEIIITVKRCTLIYNDCGLYQLLSVHQHPKSILLNFIKHCKNGVFCNFYNQAYVTYT